MVKSVLELVWAVVMLPALVLRKVTTFLWKYFVEMKKTVDIDAPPDRVWTVMAAVERWHEWTASITSIRRLEGGPFTVGSRAHVVQPRLRPGIWTVTQLEPGRSFTWSSGVPGLRVIGSHLVEPTEKGSRVTLSIEFKGLLSGLADRVFRKLNDEYLGMEAAGLKRKCEGPRSALVPVG